MIERLKWQHFKKHDRLPDIHINNMVHDSVEVECSYRDFFLALKYIDYAMTTGVRKVLKNRCSFELNVDLDIDFEIGADGKGMQKFDNSYESLVKGITHALNFQREELKHNIDVNKELQNILSYYKDGPSWLIEQIDSK